MCWLKTQHIAHIFQLHPCARAVLLYLYTLENDRFDHNYELFGQEGPEMSRFELQGFACVFGVTTNVPIQYFTQTHKVRQNDARISSQKCLLQLCTR